MDAMQERLIHFPEDMTAKLGMLTVTHIEMFFAEEKDTAEKEPTR